MEAKHVDSADHVRHSILFVCTSTNLSTWGAETGLWLQELSIPYMIFKDAGYRITMTSIRGNSPPLDPACLEDGLMEDRTRAFMSDEVSQQKLRSALSLSNLIATEGLDSFACIFLCGGHGCVVDFPYNPDIKEAVEYIYNKNKACVASICHGAFGLLDSLCSNTGQVIVLDKFVAVFMNDEEKALGLTNQLPLLLQSEIDRVGAICLPSTPWKPTAVVDGRVVTGQNPQSAEETAMRVLDVLRSLGPLFSPSENVNQPWRK